MQSSSDLHTVAEDLVGVVGFSPELRQPRMRVLVFEFQELVLFRRLHVSS